MAMNDEESAETVTDVAMQPPGAARRSVTIAGENDIVPLHRHHTSLFEDEDEADAGVARPSKKEDMFDLLEKRSTRCEDQVVHCYGCSWCCPACAPESLTWRQLKWLFVRVTGFTVLTFMGGLLFHLAESENEKETIRGAARDDCVKRMQIYRSLANQSAALNLTPNQKATLR